MSVPVIILTVLVIVLVWHIVQLEARLEAFRERRTRVDHIQCTAQVARVVGHVHEAEVLRRAAAAYDSVQGQHRLNVVINQYRPKGEGPSVPALWMLDRADTTDPEVEHG